MILALPATTRSATSAMDIDARSKGSFICERIEADPLRTICFA